MKQEIVRDMVKRFQLAEEEKERIAMVLDAGEMYGYGNMISWLATE